MINVDIHINSDCEKYSLIFLLDINLKPTMCWLQFKDESIEAWDNEDYLENLYNWIDSKINKAQCHPDWLACFYDVVEVKGMYEDIEVVYEMFNKAIEMGLWEQNKELKKLL